MTTKYVYIERTNGSNGTFQFKRFSVFAVDETDPLKAVHIADVDGVNPWHADKAEPFVKGLCQSVTAPMRLMI